VSTPAGHLAPALPSDRLERRFTFAELQPPVELLALAVGYPGGEVPEVLAEAVEAIAALGEALWSIQGGCLLHDDVLVDPATQRLRMGGIDLHPGDLVAGKLARSSSVGAFLCTAGRGIEELSHSLMAGGDPFAGYLASAMGSLVVDAAMDRLQEELAVRLAGRGLLTTNRYSPGACGWPVSDQQLLFRLLPPGYCGVRLTDTSLMQPVKSVSGVIGVGAQVRFNEYACAPCELEACMYRDVKKRKLIARHHAH
jgi:hypothetical protein